MTVATVQLTGGGCTGLTVNPRHLALCNALPTTVRLGRNPPRVPFRAPNIAPYMKALMKGQTIPDKIDWYTKAAESIARMYLNDTYGDCVVASAGHRCGVWSANDPDSADSIVLAKDAEIKSEYFYLTGGSDSGLNIQDALTYWTTTGFLANGKRYKNLDFVGFDWTSKELTQIVIALFGTVCIGINLPNAWTSSAVWDVTNSYIVGGHDVSGFGYGKATVVDAYADGVVIASWGRLYLITWAAWTRRTWLEEAWAIVPQYLWTGADKMAPSLANLDQLVADLAVIKSGGIPVLPNPTPVPALVASPASGVVPLKVGFEVVNDPGPFSHLDLGDSAVIETPTFPEYHNYNLPGTFPCSVSGSTGLLKTTVVASAIPPSPPPPPPPPPIPGPPWDVTGTCTVTTPGPFGRTVTGTIKGTAAPPSSVDDSPNPLPTSEFSMFNGIIKQILSMLTGWLPFQRWAIIRDIADQLQAGKSEDEVRTYCEGKYGKLTPEQWAAIIQLIITVLPLIISIFGGG